MRSFNDRAGRGIALCLATILLSTTGPALAHEDHDKLGAGPGPSKAEQIATNAAAPTESADVVNMHEGMASAHEEAVEHQIDVAEANKTFGQRLVSWLGRMHTVIIHFPIAMFIGALLVELYGIWRKEREYERAAQVMLVVGALGAVLAAFLGWFAGGFYLTDRNAVLMIHRWLGTGIAVLGFVLLYFAASARRAPDRPRTIYWIVLGAMTVAIAVQGFLGGTFMHGGINHLAF